MNYSDIFNNLTLSFKNAFNKTGAENAVIGISGGIDSALVSSIACAAIGKDRVKGFFMPYKTSSEHSYNDALKLSEKYGFQLDIVDISAPADAFIKICENTTPLRKGNIMARCRMIILFDKAAENKGIVIGTTNRTELLLGYGTWYGDTASSINIIGELYKREVYGVSNAAEMVESIIKKAPTADLWLGQTDEAELGFTYELIDNILYDIEQQHLCRNELYEKYDKESVDKIIKRVVSNSFKRHTPFICQSGIYKRSVIDENIFLNLDK